MKIDLSDRALGIGSADHATRFLSGVVIGTAALAGGPLRAAVSYYHASTMGEWASAPMPCRPSNPHVTIGSYRSAGSPAEPIPVHMVRTPRKPGLREHDQNRAELLATSFETFERNLRARDRTRVLRKDHHAVMELIQS